MRQSLYKKSMSSQTQTIRNQTASKGRGRGRGDLTSGSVTAHLLKMGLPMAWGILAIISFQLADIFFVGKLGPDHDVFAVLKAHKQESPKQDIQTALADILPKRLAQMICEMSGAAGRLADLPDTTLTAVADMVNTWKIKPSGTEGYRTAEVTLGGVDTNELSSKTMEAKNQSGLYFIGEVVDVTGHLGGFNFQWAWSSGYAAGQAV